MLGKGIAQKAATLDRGFRWRGHEISRLEGLSDAVFAFAVTLLIVSLEVPRTFSELWETMHGFVPFAVSFAMLIQIWHAQFVWFRRYALQDTTSVALNTALLFTVLFYVYPLKFLFTYLVAGLLTGHAVARFPDGRVEPMLQQGEGVRMMIIYDVGFIAIFLLFVAMYWHAWRRRESLDLTAPEQFLTIEKLGANACFAIVGAISLALALIGGERATSWAGLCFFLIPVFLTPYFSVMGAKRRKRGLV